MRLRNIRGSKDVIASCPFVVQEPESCRGRWAEVFGNENPIHIEVGMGKGRFLMDMAVLHPEINYIGIEMYDSVLLRAVQKREKLETELKNLFSSAWTRASFRKYSQKAKWTAFTSTSLIRGRRTAMRSGD